MKGSLSFLELQNIELASKTVFELYALSEPTREVGSV